MRWAARFYFEQFLFGFCRHIPLVAVVVAILALLIVPEVNQAFGIRFLLWHEDALKQGAVGFALGVAIVQTLIAGYLLESQRTSPKHRPNLAPLGPALTYGIGILLSLMATAAPLLITQQPFWVNVLSGWPLALGVLPAIGFYLVGLGLITDSDRKTSWIGDLGQYLFNGLSHIKLLKVPKACPNDMALHGVAVIAFGFSMVVYLSVGIGPLGLFSPLVGVFALMGILVAAYGFFEYFLDRVQPALALGFVGLLLLGGLSKYQIRIPDLEELYRQPIKLEKYNPIAECDLLAPESVDFCAEARGPYMAGQKRPLVVICVSGGGIRAAAWTTAVLHELEKAFARMEPTPVDFPCHVRVITGASGGMVGAAYYVANLPNPPPTPFKRDNLMDQYDAITADCLSPIVHALTYHDIRAAFSPFGHPKDRGQALEQAWAKNLNFALEQPVVRLRAGEKAGWRPSLVFAPMLVEDGRRLLISNLDLRGVASNDGNILQEDRDPQSDPALPLREHLNRFSYESYEYFRLFAHSGQRDKLRLATAARLSASFPLISPAATLPTEPRRRVVDAGYYDNDGVSLAASWLFSGSNRDWIRKHASKVVLIQIRDGASEPRRKLRVVPDDTPSALARGLEFSTSPITALFNARVGSSAFRNDGLLEILSQLLVTEMQLRPLLNELNEYEVGLLKQERAREIWLGTMAALGNDPEKKAQFRQALQERQEKDDTPRQRAKMQQMTTELEQTELSPEQRQKWQLAMRGIRYDDRPVQWVDRLLREPEMPPASLEMTPKLEAELRASFAQRLNSAEKVEDLLDRVKLTFDRQRGEPFFVTLTCEYSGDASLSWYLTQQERGDILSSATRLRERINLLKTWWMAPTAQDGMVGSGGRRNDSTRR
jgi:hypothetical protein